jgi:nitroreductase
MSDGTAGTNDLWDAIYTQRAIRYFKPEPVPEDLIFKVIEAGTMAPSGTNLQPWGFVVIRDDATRKAIADNIRERFLGNEQMKGFIESGKSSADRTQRLMMSGVSNIVTNLDSAPVFIVPCLHNVASPAREGLLAGSSIYQAVQNMLLAARGLGLGTVMTTFQAGMADELTAMMKLPENTTPVALIPMGWPDRKFGPLNRKPVEEVTFWETWGTTKARA